MRGDVWVAINKNGEKVLHIDNGKFVSKKVIDKPLDTNFDTIIQSQNEIYELVKEKIDINNENIKAIDNNLMLL